MVTGTKGERRRISSIARGKVVGVDVHNLGQPRQHLVHVARIFADHDDAVVLFVGGNRHAVAVIDQAACGRQQADVDPVFLGQQAELIGLFDLHGLHPPAQGTDHTKLQPPTTSARRLTVRALAMTSLGARFICICPLLPTSPGAVRDTPKMKCAANNTSG